jgi:hypothetical protein
MLKAHVPVARNKRFNVEQPVDLWLSLRCSVMSSNRWFTARFMTITDGQSTTCAAPPADTRRVVLARSI